MPLSAGTILGPYEILSPLGAGGMGEVHYCWTDEANHYFACSLVNRSPLLPSGEKDGMRGHSSPMESK